jgi:hypothetical protein
MKITIKILALGIIICSTSCAFRNKPTGVDINNGIDAVLLQQNLQQIENLAEDTAEQLKEIQVKTKAVQKVVIKQPISEDIIYISDKMNGIFTSSEVAKKHVKAIQATTENGTERARDIEVRTRPSIDWAYLSRWAGLIVLVVILGYLGLLPLVIVIVKKIIKGLVSVVVTVLDEIDGDKDFLTKYIKHLKETGPDDK